jgi:hypothetical protein
LRKFVTCFAFAFLLLSSLSALCDDRTTTLDELLKKHLDSIGSSEARSAAQARAASGKFSMEVVQGGTGGAVGDAGVISSGKMNKIMMKTDSPRYAGERFWFTGKHVVAPVTDVASRTYLSDFMYHNESVLRDGLFSGVISTSWALLDLNGRGAKLKYDGIKTIDGQDLHQVTYIPKKSAGELEIHLYFDPQTFHHVMSRYRYEVAPYMNVAPGRDRQATTQNASKTIYTIEERFSEFKTVDGITLPSVWDIKYSVEPVRAILLHWRVELTRVTSNPNVDLKAIFPEE